MGEHIYTMLGSTGGLLEGVEIKCGNSMVLCKYVKVLHDFFKLSDSIGFLVNLGSSSVTSR